MNKVHAPGEIPKKLTIATFNTFGVPTSRPSPIERYGKLCDSLQTSDIDIVNLQEVYTRKQLRFLQKGLTHFPYLSFKPSPIGPRGALVTFSKLPVRRENYISFFQATKSVDRSDLPEFSLVKSALKGILISRLPTIPMTIFNVHLTANKDNDWSPENRFHSLHEAQLDVLINAIKSRQAKDEDIVVDGDFNIASDSALYRNFVLRSGLTDAFGGHPSPTFHSEFLEEGREPHCIDHLLKSDADDRYEVVEASTLFDEQVTMSDGERHYISDHIGLRAVLLATSNGTVAVP